MEALREAFKELLRVVVLAAIPILVTGLESGYIDYRVLSTVVIIAGLKFIDKLLHETGKDKNNSLKTGLTRF